MERCAVGEAAGRACKELNATAERREFVAPARNCLPKKGFARYPSPVDDAVPSHLPVTIMREPLFVRRILTSMVAVTLLCGVASLAQAQNAAPKTPNDAAKPAAAAATKPAPAATKPATPAAKSAAATKPEPAAAAAGGAEPTLIGQFGTWGAYTATPNGKKVCFALAKPSSSKTNPPNRPRDPAYAFISTRPAEKVVNEVSVMIGYTLKPGSESTLEVGGGSYAMYTQGISAKGTETTDTFSLKGLSQALDKLAQDCKR
jgi:hypothetical protein